MRALQTEKYTMKYERSESQKGKFRNVSKNGILTKANSLKVTNFDPKTLENIKFIRSFQVCRALS